MLGNLKDFISVVQDGLTTNNNIRQKLQDVQKVTNIFKEKQKLGQETKVNYGVGGDLLEKYQEDWSEIHSNAEANAKAAEEVDKLVLQLHVATKSRLQSAVEMAQNISYLPNLTVSVAQCIDSLKNLQTLLNNVEQDLVEVEEIVERNKMEKWKIDHYYQISLYKEKKMASLEEVRAKLTKENAEQRIKRERQMLADMQAKRDNCAAAFQNDIEQYLHSGSVPIKEPSSPQTLELEQVQLDEDKEDLEKFLDS